MFPDIRSACALQLRDLELQGVAAGVAGGATRFAVEDAPEDRLRHPDFRPKARALGFHTAHTLLFRGDPQFPVAGPELHKNDLIPRGNVLLVAVRPANLQVTTTALTGLPGPLGGSGFIEGSLYGFTITGEIVRIDTLNGAASVLRSYDSGLTPEGPPVSAVFGLVGDAAVPEPATLWLSGLALVGIGIGSRRLRRLRL